MKDGLTMMERKGEMEQKWWSLDFHGENQDYEQVQKQIPFIKVGDRVEDNTEVTIPLTGQMQLGVSNVFLCLLERSLINDS